MERRAQTGNRALGGTSRRAARALALAPPPAVPRARRPLLNAKAQSGGGVIASEHPCSCEHLVENHVKGGRQLRRALGCLGGPPELCL